VLFLGMLPASLLFPALAVFLASRNEAVRRLRTPGLGFLTLAAGWVVCFFSLSSSKLPTYILPAIPCVCLVLGRLLDAVLLPAGATSAASPSPLLRWTSLRLPRWALVGWGLLGFGGAAADVVMGTDGWLGMATSVAVGAISLALLAAALLNRLPGPAANWSLVGGAALVAMTLGFNDLYPEIAARRSRLLQARAEVEAARELARSEHVPVVLYGTLSESTSFYMDDCGLTKFATDQYDDLFAFTQTHPRIVMISTHSNAASLEHSLPETLALTDDPAKEFVFELVDRRLTGKHSLARRQELK
jgi:dolichol-phosphate mannosyltransferase